MAFENLRNKIKSSVKIKFNQIFKTCLLKILRNWKLEIEDCRFL